MPRPKKPAAESKDGGRIERETGLLLRLHRAVFGRRPNIAVLSAFAVYAFVVLVFGERLEISNNYFVILPVVACALSYGLAGGIVCGALGLPANLLLFHLLGHPEYSPDSKLIAEFSGIIIGSVLGYLSEYFRQLELEIRRRMETESSLWTALDNNRLLLMELNHRVKNNLNVIKSLIQMQRSRTSDPSFLDAADKLSARVFAIARAHDRLYDQGELCDILPREYLADILSMYRQEKGSGPLLEAELPSGRDYILPDTAIPLGLILNEAVSNAMKYAFPPEVKAPIVRVRFAPEGERWVLEVRDNGIGFDSSVSYPAGLGIKIIRGLAGQLHGTVSWHRDGGTVFRLEFPLRKKNGETAADTRGPGPGAVSPPLQ